MSSAEAAAERQKPWSETFLEINELLRKLPEGKVLLRCPNGYDLVTASRSWKQDYEHDQGLVPLQWSKDGKAVDEEVFDSIYARFYSKYDVDSEHPVIGVTLNAAAAYAGRRLSATLSMPMHGDARDMMLRILKHVVGWLKTRVCSAVAVASSPSLTVLAKSLVGEVVAGVKIDAAEVLAGVVSATGMKDGVRARVFVKPGNDGLVFDIFVGAQRYKHTGVVGRGWQSVKRALKAVQVTAATEPETDQSRSFLKMLLTAKLRSKHFSLRFSDLSNDCAVVGRVVPDSPASKVFAHRRTGIFSVQAELPYARIRARLSSFNDGADTHVELVSDTVRGKVVEFLKFMLLKLKALDHSVTPADEIISKVNYSVTKLHTKAHKIAPEMYVSVSGKTPSVRGNFVSLDLDKSVKSEYGKHAGSFSEFVVTANHSVGTSMVHVTTEGITVSKPVSYADDGVAYVESVLKATLLDLDSRLL